MGVSKGFSSELKKVASQRLPMEALQQGIHLIDFSILLYSVLRHDDAIHLFHQKPKVIMPQFREMILKFDQEMKDKGLQYIHVLDGLGSTPVKLASIHRSRNFQAETDKVVALQRDPTTNKSDLLAAMKASVFGSRPDIDAYCCQVMRENGIAHVRAPYEADSQLAEMDRTCAKYNINAYVWSTDGDMVVLKVRNVVYEHDFAKSTVCVLSCRSAVGKLAVSRLIFGEGLSVQLELSDTLYGDCVRFLALLLGTDYLPSIKGFSFKKACQIVTRFAQGALTIKDFVDGVARDQSLKWCKTYDDLGFTGTPGNGYVRHFTRAWNLFLYPPVFRVVTPPAPTDVVALMMSDNAVVELDALNPFPATIPERWNDVETIGYAPEERMIPFAGDYFGFFRAKYSRVVGTCPARGAVRRPIAEDLLQQPTNSTGQKLPWSSVISFNEVAVPHVLEKSLRVWLQVRGVRALTTDKRPALDARAQRVLDHHRRIGHDNEPRVQTEEEFLGSLHAAERPLETEGPIVWTTDMAEVVSALRHADVKHVTDDALYDVAVKHGTGDEMSNRVMRLLEGGHLNLSSLKIAKTTRKGGGTIYIISIEAKASMKKQSYVVNLVFSDSSVLDMNSQCTCPAGGEWVCAHKYAALMVIRYIQIEFLQLAPAELLKKYDTYVGLRDDLLLSSALVYGRKPLYY